MSEQVNILSDDVVAAFPLYISSVRNLEVALTNEQIPSTGGT
jgi:hypothetical protein